MPLQAILGKIFGSSAKEVVTSVGSVLDNLITNKEELAKAKLELEKEVNRHFETLQSNLLKEKELEVHDRNSARDREVEFVKATGKMDWMQIFVGMICMVSFAVLLIYLMKYEVPVKNEHILINAVGILEGLVLSVASYYFGSSAGSRLKDTIRKP